MVPFLRFYPVIGMEGDALARDRPQRLHLAHAMHGRG